MSHNVLKSIDNMYPRFTPVDQENTTKAKSSPKKTDRVTATVQRRYAVGQRCEDTALALPPDMTLRSFALLALSSRRCPPVNESICGDD
jgi:hypothetical protein